MSGAPEAGVSIIVPVFNEQDSVESLHEHIQIAMKSMDRAYEVLYVDDGSTDGSWAVLKRMAAADPHVRLVRLRKNRNVVELAFSLPGRFKLSGLTTKYLLRRTLQGLVPKEISFRKKKGFGIPLARWFRRELQPVLRELCSPDTIRRGGIFRPEAVDRLIAEHREGRHDHRKKLFTVLAFQLWASWYRPG